MNEDFLKKIEAKLKEEEARLLLELKKFTQEDKHDKEEFQATWPEMGDKDDENIAEVAMYSDMLSLEKNLEKRVRDVRDALERIKKGKHGVCKYCKREIQEKRLEARPVSSACIECKKKLTMEE